MTTGPQAMTTRPLRLTEEDNERLVKIHSAVGERYMSDTLRHLLRLGMEQVEAETGVRDQS